MLMGCNNSRLLCGGHARFLDNSGRIDSQLFEFIEQNFSISARADHSCRDDFCAQSDDVVDDIAGTAHGVILFFDRYHLDRCLRGYAIHFTPEIFVEHQITHNKDVASVEF